MPVTAYNSSLDQWYQYINMADGPQATVLLAVFLLRALFASLGILFNAAIVYITVRSKSLHGVCNVLIALESFFAIFQDGSYFVSAAVFASGLRFIRYQICFPLLSLGGLFGNSAQMTMVLTGVDRLLCVLFPIWYQSRDAKYYFLFVPIVLTIYGVYQFILSYVGFLQSDADTLMSCSTHEMVYGNLSNLNYYNGMTLSGTIMTLYGLIWVVAFLLRPTAKSISDSNKRLLKSLIFIIAMNLCGVFFKISMNYIFKNFWPISPVAWNAIAIGMSFLTIAVYSANAPVLYVVSKEYRHKFDQHFKWLPQLLNKTAASNNNNNNNHRVASTIAAFTTTIASSQHRRLQNQFNSSNNNGSNRRENNVINPNSNYNGNGPQLRNTAMMSSSNFTKII